MDVYRRYFRVTSGPLMQAVQEAEEINDAAHEQYAAILKEVGAEPTYYHRGRRLTGIIFEGEPDRSVYKRACSGWYPKKNCKQGRELVARLDAITTRDPAEALKAVGLPGNTPVLFANGKCYLCTLLTIPEDPPTVYVTVPWWDADPADVERYRQNEGTGTWHDMNLEHLLWEPTPDMQEVKGWYVDRHIDKYNERVKAKRAWEVE